MGYARGRLYLFNDTIHERGFSQDVSDAGGHDVIMTVSEEATMNEKMNVAEAKKKFSELLSRTAYNGERFIINRRGGSVLVKRGGSWHRTRLCGFGMEKT